MSAALIGLASAVLTAAMALGATLWTRRRSAPDTYASIVTASSLLLEQLQHRIAVLEVRIAEVEAENLVHEAKIRAYEMLHGPLPDLGEHLWGDDDQSSSGE